MKCAKAPVAPVANAAPASLEEVKVLPLTEPEQQRHLQRLLKKYHCLGSLKPFGERIFYAAVDAQERWLALLLFGAAVKYPKHRDRWIGWT